MTILVSSSRQWNPGDEFIRDGVQYLINKVIGPGAHSWLLWNRNPDLFIDGWHNSNMKEVFFSNSVKRPNLNNVDLVVFAGTPEWFGNPVARLINEVLLKANIPTIYLGVGSAERTIPLCDIELEVMSRKNTLITTRNIQAAQYINNALGVSKATPLPCPAIFAADDITANRQHLPRNNLGLIVQSHGIANQSISSELVVDFHNTVHSALHNDDKIMVFYNDEFWIYSEQYKGQVLYDFEHSKYYDHFKSFSKVGSTRLHGAIAALSCETPACLIASPDNNRIRWTQELYGDDVLPIFASFTDFYDFLPHWDLSQHRELLLLFKRDLEEKYLKTLKSFWVNL